MKEKLNTLLAFCFGLVLTLAMPVVWPGCRLTYFGPFLIILYYRKSWVWCLWASLGCGLLLDILSAHQRFGLYALNYVLTTGVLYRYKRQFFVDRPSTVPVMTALFAMISTFFQVGLLSIFEKGVALSGAWWMTDMFFMPLMDGVYGYVVYVLPGIFMPKLTRREYFNE